MAAIRRRARAGWRRGLGLAIAALAFAGCGEGSGPPAPTSSARQATPAATAGPDAEPTPMTETSFIQTFEVKQSTVLRLSDSWAIGVQMVYEGEYADEAGQSQRGPLARLSLLDPAPGAKASTVTVHRGAIVEAGNRYQVIEITPGGDNGSPGSSQSKVTLGQLP